NWNKKVGQTADYARAEGETVEDTQFVVGIRIWF
ncbi:MAG: copper resistance protein B, partial [Gammaproteobacteria bacterium]|nr:copper resistance protein B [Gammaproteobacteria bacterium]MBT3488799.1 copper resistance protein B [Gammaproteobacteria bacterium]MBT3719126.1 copper resistance protein B [Gammaproteobacteria bacterium]MBT3843540.1 copper resistance protein B [Gammaproteobacteria bacterium]MBT3892760.1 copper resistance protein B [Gammaproteobacteria bacterium]